MNLLFLDSIERDVFGGMEEWIRLVSSGLQRRGHAVTVASRPQSALFERIASTNGSVELLPLEISGDFNPLTIARINRYLERATIDVVVANFNKDLRLGGLATRFDGHARCVWSVGLDITKDNLVHRLLTPRLMDGAIVPSQSLKGQITRHGYIDPDQVTVIPIGIPDDQQTIRSDEARVKLREKYGLGFASIIAVTLARFVDQKGHRYLLEAAQSLIANYPNLKFLWCGSGPREKELRAKTRELGLESQVIFAGMLSGLSLELAGADLMIHPSIEEPFGIAILEGMRSGLPVVASRVGGIPEVLGAGYEFLVEAQNGPALALAVSTLLNSDRCAEVEERLRARYIEHFSDVTMLDRVERYLEAQVRRERQHG